MKGEEMGEEVVEGSGKMKVGAGCGRLMMRHFVREEREGMLMSW